MERCKVPQRKHVFSTQVLEVNEIVDHENRCPPATEEQEPPEGRATMGGGPNKVNGALLHQSLRVCIESWQRGAVLGGWPVP
jgi:hypothetical protein